GGAGRAPASIGVDKGENIRAARILISPHLYAGVAAIFGVVEKVLSAGVLNGIVPRGGGLAGLADVDRFVHAQTRGRGEISGIVIYMAVIEVQTQPLEIFVKIIPGMPAGRTTDQ